MDRPTGGRQQGKTLAFEKAAAKLIGETIRAKRESSHHDEVLKLKPKEEPSPEEQVREQLAKLETDAISRTTQVLDAHSKRTARYLYNNSNYSQRDGDQIDEEKDAYYARKNLKAQARELKKQGGLDSKQRLVLKAYGVL